jgi:CRP-like cAMP-binding protein
VARPAGTLLIGQGELSTGAWLVRRGRVLVTNASSGGDEVLCLLRGRGSMIGLEALRGEPADYEAWTLEPSQLCHLSAEGLRAWVGDTASPARALLDVMLSELQRSREERVVLARGALERVARFLARTAGAPLGFEQQLLARLLRMRPETLSRALKRLRQAGAIAPGRGAVRVADASKLEPFISK